jgi:hypothetical protein
VDECKFTEEMHEVAFANVKKAKVVWDGVAEEWKTASG